MSDSCLRGVPLALLMMCIRINSALGHDFWVQPASYWLRPGIDLPYTLQVGHGPFRQRSLIPLSRILRFEAIGPGGSRVNLRSRLQLGGRISDGAVDFAAPGTYVLVLQTDARAYSLLPSIRFNDYLRYEGLTPALDYRERTIECRWTDPRATVFPYRGTYVRHLGRDNAVADANQLILFNRAEGYQISHPLAGGDASLSLALEEGLLRELVPKDYLRPGSDMAFRVQRVRIDPRTQALVGVLRHGLSRAIAERCKRKL